MTPRERLKAQMDGLSSDRVRLLVTSAHCCRKWAELGSILLIPTTPRTWEDIVDFVIAASSVAVTPEERMEAVRYAAV